MSKHGDNYVKKKKKKKKNEDNVVFVLFFGYYAKNTEYQSNNMNKSETYRKS